jgi:Cu/Ag efflux protein CusF
MLKVCTVTAALLTVLALTSCAKRYPLTGTVVSVDLAASTVTVKHSEIPGYMKAMTMTFPVKDKAVLRSLSPGDEITADLVVSRPEYRLENIRKKPRPAGNK